MVFPTAAPLLAGGEPAAFLLDVSTSCEAAGLRFLHLTHNGNQRFFKSFLFFIEQ